MKLIKNTCGLIVLFLLGAVCEVFGQQDNLIPDVEKVGLLTDRALYIAGEQVHFSAFMTSEIKPEPSKILYVEIITPDGKRVNGNKYSISNASSFGCLTIPGDIITGIYYLRAYTKYMRNVGPYAYAYVPVKIVNPLSNAVLMSNDMASSPDEIVKGEDDHENAFTLITDKQEYAINENVNVTVSLTDPNDKFIFPRSGGRGQAISVSVVPESFSKVFLRKQESQDPDVGFRRNLTQSTLDTLVGFRRNPTSNGHTLPAIDFYPETRGVSITGQLRDGITGNSVANGRVNLSIIGQGRDFEAMNTDSTGHFFFALPDYSGYRDIFLCAEKDSLTKPILLVDNDFCSVPVHLPSPEFSLSAEERTLAYNMARNIQISNHFNSDTILCGNKNEVTEQPFYGGPNDILVFDKFVQLPTLEEYFNELPSAVRVRKQNGHKYFKVIGERAEMNFFNPLVMVDWVAVNNPETILAASPNNISRIEVVTVPYIKGNITYGGIVSIISKKRDFAGIDLPASGIFFNYLFSADTCHCRIVENLSAEMPDVRNTLYWNPILELDANNSAAFSFKTPATPGKYDIVIKGIEISGDAYEQRVELLVKEAEK